MIIIYYDMACILILHVACSYNLCACVDSCKMWPAPIAVYVALRYRSALPIGSAREIHALRFHVIWIAYGTCMLVHICGLALSLACKCLMIWLGPEWPCVILGPLDNLSGSVIGMLVGMARHLSVCLVFHLPGSASMACDLLTCYLVWLGFLWPKFIRNGLAFMARVIGNGLYVVSTPLRIVWLGEPGCSLLFYRPWRLAT